MPNSDGSRPQRIDERSTVNSPRTDEVLVVDDDVIIRSLVHEVMSEAGFVVREADTGENGLISFEARPADIVLLDVMMPGINGFDVCEQLRSSVDGRHVPVLMMTGSDSADAVERAFSVGATDFTTKPLNLQLLVHRVRYMLRAKKTADQLRDRERSLLDVQRIAQIGNWEFNLVQDEFFCSDILVEILSLSSATISREKLLNSVQEDDKARVDNALRQTLDTGSANRFEFGWKKPDGAQIVLSFNAREFDIGHDSREMQAGAMQDITERRRAETRIRTLAYYDAVTGLPNRTLLHEQLQQAVALSLRLSEPLAVLFIDMDHFKRINDTWGHPTGDEVLRLAARRIRECLRSSDFVAAAGDEAGEGKRSGQVIARIGGDEFVVMLPRLRRVEDAAIVARRINMAMARPFSVQSTEVYVSSSIGISLCPEDSQDVDSLLKQADGAMYEAKQSGRNCFHFYTKEIQQRAFQRLDVETRLRRAIERDEFVLHYQPKIDLKTGAVCGIEALVRWQAPDVGMISPAEFIPIAEDSGLIVPLGQWVLKTACAQIQQVGQLTGRAIAVSVNLSALQLKHGNLVQVVEQSLIETGLPASLLELELTESVLIDDAQAQLKLLHELKSLGVVLSIDDFGTGYSSLSYLKRFPIDALKIDQTFVRDLLTDSDDVAIVKAAIGLAHSLRLRVIAEGVETQAQHDILSHYGCDEVQGYLHSKPLPLDALVLWIKSRRAESVQVTD
ncbi:MAG: EAL domain-containing protein [Burkholderiaceae bacterium]